MTIQFVQNIFVEEYDPTVADSYRKLVGLDGGPVVLNILDTAGEEEHSPLWESWLKQGQGFLLAYSITSRPSFDALAVLQQAFLHINDTDSMSSVSAVLCATKADQADSREVSREEGEQLAQEWGCPFFETSALSRINVEEAFTTLAKRVYKDTQVPHACK
uniref:Uncharacterized protein n=1 Tax=Arcella intermedia TaxID=1963864 RepID=A0A6B2LLB8_9EUKA